MKIKYLSLAFVFFFLSCTQEHDEPLFQSVVASDIVGTWNLTEYYTDNGRTITTIQSVEFIQDFTSEAKDFDAMLTFSDNPNIVESQGGFTVVLTITSQGQTEVREEDSPDTGILGSWSINNNIITIENVDYQITDFDEDVLKLKFEIDETVNAGGETFHTTATYYMTLIK